MDFQVQTLLPTNISGLLAGNGVSLVKATQTQLRSLAGVAPGDVAASGSLLLWDTNVNCSPNNTVSTTQTVVSAGTTTTLVVDGPRVVIVTGTLTHTIQLPSSLGLLVGTTYQFINTSTQALTIQDGSGINILTILPNINGNGSRILTSTINTSIAGIWRIQDNSVSGRVALDTDVILDTFRVRLTTTGGVGAQLTSTTGGSLVIVHYTGTFGGAGPTFAQTNNNLVTVTTAPTSFTGVVNIANTNNAIASDIVDTTTYIAYELRAIITSTYNYIYFGQRA